MTTFGRMVSVAFIAMGLGIVGGSRVEAGAITSTGLIQNSAGYSRSCLCTVICEAKGGCAWESSTFGAVPSLLYADALVDAQAVLPGGKCGCWVETSAKKIRLVACLEDGVTPLVCASGR